MKGEFLSTRPRGLAALTVASLLMLSPVVLAQRIFVNEVEVTNANTRNTHLDRVESVVFDGEGNIHISAPSYAIHVVPPQMAGAPPAPAPARPPRVSRGQPVAQTFVLALQNENPNSVPYMVDIFINDRHAATWGPRRGNFAIDVSEYIKVGTNTVLFNARREEGAPVGSAENVMTISLGEGSVGDGVAHVTYVRAGHTFRGNDTTDGILNTVTFEVPAPSRSR